MKLPKKVALGACLLAVAAIVAWILSDGTRVAESAAAILTQESNGQTLFKESRVEDPGAAGRSTSSKVDAIPTGPKEAIPTWPRTIRGPILITTSDGMAAVAIRGGLRFDEVVAGGETAQLRARVQDGEWMLTVNRESQLTATTAELNTDTSPQQSLRASSDGTSFASTIETGPTVHAILEKGPLLHVVDGALSSEVGAFELVMAPISDTGTSEDGQCPPRSYLELAQRVERSPHRLPPFIGTRIGWVRTKSSAWRRFAVCSGEVTVILQGGAELQVSVTKLESALMPMIVRVLSTDPEYATPVLLAEQRITEPGPVMFSGLPAGPAIARLDKLGTIKPGNVVAAKQVTILSNALNTVVLDADESLSLLGRVVVRLKRPSSSSTFHADRVSFVIEDVGNPASANPLAADPKDLVLTDSQVDWNGPALLPGEYVVGVLPLGLSSPIRIAAGSTTVAEFQLVPACSVDVTVKRLDGSQVSGAELLVRPLLSKSAVSWRAIQENPTTGTYRFTTQPGQLQIVYPGIIGSEQIQVVDVKEPTCSFDLHLPKLAPVEFTLGLTDGRNEILLPQSYWNAIRVESLDGDDGRVLATRSLAEQIGGYTALDTARMTYIVSKSGLYRFTLPSWPGLAAGSIADLMIDSSGQSHSIQLATR